MAINAVIFDLFGTLVDNFPEASWRAKLGQMAEALAMEPDPFYDLWTSRTIRNMRMGGEFPDLATHIEYVCALLGGKPTPAQIECARQLRVEYTRLNLAPREHAVEVLTVLQAQGYARGLISDCTWEVPEIWPATPFATLIEQPVFSCSVGMRKPSSDIYRLACERLQVQPQACLYVGDGDSTELTGAQRAGLTAVHICVPYEHDAVMQLAEAREWQGPRINSLRGVLDFLSP